MERPYVFNREGKRVIIPKVSSIPATMEWLAGIMSYCHKNDIKTIGAFTDAVDDMIDKQIELEVNAWLEEKVFSSQVETACANY